MVGTHWEWVTPYRVIASIAARASNRSMQITVPPAARVMSPNVNGAA